MKRNFHFTTHVKSAGLLHKILLSTRIVFLLLLVSAFQAVANKSYIEVTKLTLSMENSSIKEVLSNIEENSEFYFLYSSKVVDVQQKINVDVKNKDIFNVLDEILEETEIQYEVKDRQIILSPKPPMNAKQQYFSKVN